MKKTITLLLICLLLIPAVCAEDYSTYTKEELLTRRNELLKALTDVNTVYGALEKEEKLTAASKWTAASDESLGTIASLFPDEQFAMWVRDKLAKFSINQTVTQRELDTITKFSWESYQLHDLTGIHYLRNLITLNIRDNPVTLLPDEMTSLNLLEGLYIENKAFLQLPEWIGDLTNLKELFLYKTSLSSVPDSIGNLVNLTDLNLYESNVTSLPDSVGNLVNLKELDISHTDISALPESIGNLVNLKELDISYTDISALPECIGNLVNLENLSIRNTKIESLPDSIWGLELKELDMFGTSIK